MSVWGRTKEKGKKTNMCCFLNAKEPIPDRALRPFFFWRAADGVGYCWAGGPRQRRASTTSIVHFFFTCSLGQGTLLEMPRTSHDKIKRLARARPTQAVYLIHPDPTSSWKTKSVIFFRFRNFTEI